LLTADWLMCRVLAAWVKPPWRMTSTKLRSYLKSMALIPDWNGFQSNNSLW